MERKEAVKVAKGLLKEGNTYDGVAKELGKRGFKNSDTGKAYSNGGIYNIVHGSTQARKVKGATKEFATATGRNSYKAIVKEIKGVLVSSSRFTADAKLTAIEGILGL